ncbi:hypothetical protein ACIBSR_26885 [Streptomyces sp. NPDC049936]|uniref:hypothetical protein n=1 Tax=Streptomyces sp. NPDC049936 TaxID=3365599 RepID=UPI0037B73663
MTKLRPHQREAVDAVTAALQGPAAGTAPRVRAPTQVVTATGSGNLRSSRRAHAN